MVCLTGLQRQDFLRWYVGPFLPPTLIISPVLPAKQVNFRISSQRTETLDRRLGHGSFGMMQGWSVRLTRLKHKPCVSHTVFHFEAAFIPIILGKPKCWFSTIDVVEEQKRFSRTAAGQLPESQGRSEQFKVQRAVWVLYGFLLYVIECTLKGGASNKHEPKEVMASMLGGKNWFEYNARRGGNKSVVMRSLFVYVPCILHVL